MIKVIIWLLISVALVVAPVVLKATIPVQMVAGIVGLVSLIIGGIVVTITKLYIRTSANEAFYRTGQGKPKVIIDGGAIVIPVIHNLNRVLLETMKLEVIRLGTDALICKDFLRVDVSGEFYIRVSKNETGVKAAATTLGANATNPDQIKKRMMEKLVSALRTVAATMELNELHQNREAFAVAVQEAVTKDIEPNGFLLETVTISQLDQTDVTHLKPENVFDAQGLRKATEITQKQRVMRNQIDRDADLEITRKNVDTKKLVLNQEQDRAFAVADQAAEIANREVKKDREVAEFKIAQQEEIEKRQVLMDQEVRATEIRKETILVEEAKLKETAEVGKIQAVEVANRQKQIAIAEAETNRAAAEAKQREAEAFKSQAAEKVITAAEVEVANREKQKAVIAAEKDGETKLIEQQKDADAEAYTKTREALAEKDAAENEAIAKVQLAQADLEAKRLDADGDKAIGMVPVQVDAKRVEVERERVNVLKEELNAKEQYQGAAIQLELAKLQIAAGEKVGSEMAKSIGQFMSAADFNVFGTPETLTTMTEKFAQGLGIGNLLAGLKDGNPLLGGVVETALKATKSGLQAAKAKADSITNESEPQEKPEPKAPEETS